MEDISLNLEDTIKAYRICEIEGACRNYRQDRCNGCPVLGDYKYRYDCQYQLRQNVLAWLEDLGNQTGELS